MANDVAVYAINSEVDSCIIFPRLNSIAEEAGAYEPHLTQSLSDSEFVYAMEKVEVRALHQSAQAQLGRLFRLADLLDTPIAHDRSAEALLVYATELRQATNELENIINTLNSKKR